MRIFYVVLMFFSISGCIEPLTTFDKLPPGEWRGVLLLDRKPVISYGDDRDIRKNFDVDSELPFNFEIQYEGDSMYAVFFNGQENIKVENIIFGRDMATAKDTVIIHFSVFDTSIEAIYEDGVLEGDWVVHYRDNYRIPFKAVHGNNRRFDFTNQGEYGNVNGEWEVVFGSQTDAPFPAKGIFYQEEDKVSGTFLTETGDYRFLEGVIFKNKLYLSAFDGAHAFLFTGKLLDDGTITGTFKSGSQYTVDWQAHRTTDFELENPFGLTNFSKDKIEFSFENTEGKQVSLTDEKYQNKIKIVTIMGTWCPNCLDETKFLKEYFNENPDEEVELIAIGFERYKEKNKNITALKRFKDKLEIDYEVLYGGHYEKSLAAEKLPFLDKVISYPTMIFLDKNDKIVKVYTGFNGPATPQYLEFKKEFADILTTLKAHK